MLSCFVAKTTEPAPGGVLLKVFLNTLPISQEDICTGDSKTGSFSCETCEKFRNIILKNIFERLLIKLVCYRKNDPSISFTKL